MRLKPKRASMTKVRYSVERQVEQPTSSSTTDDDERDAVRDADRRRASRAQASEQPLQHAAEA